MGCVHYDMDSRSMSKGLNDFFLYLLGINIFLTYSIVGERGKVCLLSRELSNGNILKFSFTLYN